MDIATDQGKIGYILTHDTDLKNRNLCGTAFSMADLKSAVVGIPQGIDSPGAQGAGRVVISSSANTEKSWESDMYHNSYFTHLPIEAMRAKVRAEKHEPQNPTMGPEGREIKIVIGGAID